MVQCLQYNAVKRPLRGRVSFQQILNVYIWRSRMHYCSQKIGVNSHIVFSRPAERLQMSNNTVLVRLQAQLHPRAEKETSFLTLKKGPLGDYSV